MRCLSMLKRLKTGLKNQNIQRFYVPPPSAPSFGWKMKEKLKNFNWRLLVEFALGGGFFVSSYELYIRNQETKKQEMKEEQESEEFKRRKGAKKLLEPRKIEEEGDYVVRKDLEALLNEVVGTIYDRKYIILVGEKGSGKTTLLNHVMNGKEGIVFVKIDGETTFTNLEHKLLESIGVHIEGWNQIKAQEVFGEICASVRRKDGKKVAWVPTVIFEVEGSTPKEIIKELYKTAKQLSSDNVQARCFIVLSDANDALSMTNDYGRQRYIWIPDFTEEEAGNYLTKLGFTEDIEIRRTVIDKIGTRPVDLRNIASSKMNPKELIKNQILENVKSVENCLIKSEIFRKVFMEMKKEENSNGMDESDVKKLCNLTTTDIAEGPAVKDFHVLSYDIQNRRFQFQSRTKYHATKQYLREKK